ncbi:MAG TPA: hypothetical protein PL033_09420 [Candidatus Brocadiia bacterium]|nr:hypothetical protein [Candidatus Brocadiia bacterium]
MRESPQPDAGNARRNSTDPISGMTGRKLRPGWSAAICCSIAVVWTLLILGRQFGRVNYTTQDRGRDLYVAWRVSLGELPYRDFEWPYGPLAPIYYGTWFRFFSPSMLTFEMAETVAILLAGLGVFIACSRFAADRARKPEGYAAGLAGLLGYLVWLLVVPIHHEAHTGNHHLGALFICVVLWTLSRMTEAEIERRDSVTLGLALLLLSCVKLNMGLAFAGAATTLLAVRIGSMPPASRRTSLRAMAGGGLTLIIGLAIFYVPLVIETPTGSLTRCFPFAAGAHHDYGSAWRRVAFDIKELSLRLDGVRWLKVAAFVFTQLRALVYAIALVTCALWLAIVLLGRKSAACRAPAGTNGGGLPPGIAGPAVILTCLAAAGHELILAGSWYSVAYWAAPCVGVLVSSLAGIALGGASGRKGRLAFAAAALCAGAAMIIAWEAGSIYLGQGEWKLVDHPRGGVLHLKRAAETDDWAGTVAAASREIASLTEPGEAILVAPFDPVYLFMSDREQVCRIVDFSGYQNISPDEEAAIIRAAEDRGLRLIALSNNATGLGGERFGAPDCPTLAGYIEKNFRPHKSFGPADKPGKSHSFHGVTLYLRK